MKDTAIPTLQTTDPELLQYIDGKLHITIMGGIKFTGLDRLKVTLKIVHIDNRQKAFRHNGRVSKPVGDFKSY